MLRRTFFSCAGSALAATIACAQKLPDLYHDEAYGDAPFLSEPGWRPLLNGRDLTGWHGLPGVSNEWFTTKAVYWKRVFNPTHLVAEPAPGDRIVNGPSNRTANLVTDRCFGDCEIYVEFMTAKGSNSGVYLHGHYEVQIFDSYGFDGSLTVGDCGGIYERSDGTGGNPPARNACLAPGRWQSLRIWFSAPIFNSSGQKTRNAKILRVLLNQTPVQENVEVTGPTRGAMEGPEAAKAPLMLQGDHSAIAYRNIYIKPLQRT